MHLTKGEKEAEQQWGEEASAGNGQAAKAIDGGPTAAAAAAVEAEPPGRTGGTPRNPGSLQDRHYGQCQEVGLHGLGGGGGGAVQDLPTNLPLPGNPDHQIWMGGLPQVYIRPSFFPGGS